MTQYSTDKKMENKADSCVTHSFYGVGEPKQCSICEDWCDYTKEEYEKLTGDFCNRKEFTLYTHNYNCKCDSENYDMFYGCPKCGEKEEQSAETIISWWKLHRSKY